MQRDDGECAESAEVGLTAVYREEPLLREVLAENPSLAAAGCLIRGRRAGASQSERIRFGEAIMHVIDGKRAADRSAILHDLEGGAVTVTVKHPRHQRMVLNATFLVERDRLDEFAELVKRVDREHGERIEIRLSGPRPAEPVAGRARGRHSG